MNAQNELKSSESASRTSSAEEGNEQGSGINILRLNEQKCARASGNRRTTRYERKKQNVKRKKKIDKNRV